MTLAPHHSPAFIKAFKRVMKHAEKHSIEETKLKFRDEMLAIGHEERVRNLYRVKDKLSKKAVFFVPNGPQAAYLKNKSGSDIILKPRQIGFTTFSCIRALDLALFTQNIATGIMAHEQNKVQTIFTDITKFSYDWFKKDWGNFYCPKEQSDSSTALTFKDDGLGRPLNSSMRVLFDFRGKTVHFLHVSEAAKVENDRLNGSLNGVPDNGEIVLESTANGMGGEFYRQWELWRKHSTTAPYKGHFTPWYEFYPEDQSAWSLPEQAELTDYEQHLLENESISPAHIAWRRHIIQKKCQGDPEVFEQEYPSNDVECFLNGQNLVFGSSVIKLQMKHTRPASDVGFLLSDGAKIVWHSDNKGLISVWKKPADGTEYAIGADPSGGVGKDNGAAYVINKVTGELVARVWGQLEPSDFASTIWKLANYYNKAWICVEANNHGHAVIELLKQKNYRNLYKRKALDELTNQVTNRVGFMTTNESKLSITEKFKTACKEGGVLICDADLIAEMSTFVQLSSRTGRSIRREASAGAHDDLVMAACLTWEMNSVRVAAPSREIAQVGEFDPDTGFFIARE